MKFIQEYLQRRKERKIAIEKAQAELLFAYRFSRIFGVALNILAPASEFYQQINEKSDEEKTAELRLKYLKGEIKK